MAEKNKKSEKFEPTEEDKEKFQHIKDFFKLESAAIGESGEKNYYLKCLHCKTTKARK